MAADAVASPPRDPIVIALRSLWRAGETAGDQDVMRLAEGMEVLYRLGAIAGAADLVEAAIERVRAVLGGAQAGEENDDGAAGDPGPADVGHEGG